MFRNPRRSARVLAVAAAVTALAATPASARPAEEFMPGSNGDSGGQPVPVRVVEVSADPGFDWGDAGIGATGMLALAAIAGGAAIATGHRPGARQSPQPVR
jgi:hypothetical protein